MSLLKDVQSGRKLKPLALMAHAPHGIGKSTFGTEAPNPIYIGNEENDELDVARFPKVKTWQDLVNQLNTLLCEEHGYKTLVIDTVDGLEQIAEVAILSEKINAGKTMATAYGGYGKAYEKMANMFLNIRDNFIIPLRDNKGMNIILLCHSKKVKHEDPMTNTSYDHYETAIHKTSKPIFEDWVSAIFFMNYYLVRAESSSGKEYAESDGFRMIYTEERPSHVAKNRFDLEPEMEFNKTGTYAKLRAMILEHYKKVASTPPEEAKKPVNKEPKEKVKESTNEPIKEPIKEPKKDVSVKEAIAISELKQHINELSDRLSPDIKSSVESSIARAGSSVSELNRILTKIQGILA